MWIRTTSGTWKYCHVITNLWGTVTRLERHRPYVYQFRCTEYRKASLYFPSSILASAPRVREYLSISPPASKSAKSMAWLYIDFLILDYCITETHTRNKIVCRFRTNVISLQSVTNSQIILTNHLHQSYSKLSIMTHTQLPAKVHTLSCISHYSPITRLTPSTRRA